MYMRIYCKDGSLNVGYKLLKLRWTTNWLLIFLNINLEPYQTPDS